MEPTLVIIYAVMFLAAIMLLEGGLQLISALRNPEGRAVNRRLRLLDSGYDADEIYRILRRKRDDTRWMRIAAFRALNTYLQQAGISISLWMLLAILMLLAASGAMIGSVFLNLPLPIAVGGSTLLVAALAFARVAAKRRARLAALENQLPEMLDLIVRSVRSGHPLSTALRLAADELPEPLGSEVGLLVDETTYGIALTDAVDGLAGRIGLADYKYFSVVSKITGKTGGNISNILDKLAGVMRERNRMRRKIRAISAEGRTSGLIMSLAPPSIAGIIMLSSPSFFLDIANDDLFPRFLIFVIIMRLAKFLVLRKMVSFDF